MHDVEERILSYPHLPPAEQREIHDYVESNPEWASLLRDVRALEAATMFPEQDVEPAPLVATYVVVQDLHPETIPPALERAFEQLEARIEKDEELQQEIAMARERLAEAQTSFHASDRFEQLTGHRLEAGSNFDDVASGTRTTEPSRGGTLPLVGLIRDLPVLVRGGVAAAALVVLLYGALFAVSSATQSTLDRLAVIEADDAVVEEYVETQTRAVVPGATAVKVDSLYVAALTTLRGARVSTLGLFPRYEPGPLRRSEGLFRQVLTEVDSSSFLALETHFYLGKIALARGDRETARAEFREVVEGEGRKMTEAKRILRRLQEMPPSDRGGA